ncbi:hypothetical protein DDE82_003209 [Stemphylium lycopersici]|uniref:Signal peptidase complex subunit 1 n=1 Tax=Stemphylium lycopersici TaxID=183478 RepID=A0A364N3L7_STELY|nr:hypothetical protein DDE82_003209 [Stemphylium lycopersici]RAR11053.1 hypothetical protein DDE83_004811 [Stemphylium lycopersici]
MADQLLEQVRDAVEGQIDFEGQRLAEMLSTVLLGAAGILAFIVGFMAQDIRLALYIGLAGTALTFLVVVPPWPFYNKNMEDWLPAHNSTSQYNVDVDGEKPCTPSPLPPPPPPPRNHNPNRNNNPHTTPYMSTAHTTASPRAPRGKPQSPAQPQHNNSGRQSQRKPRNNRAPNAHNQRNGPVGSPSKGPIDPALAENATFSGDDAHMPSGPRSMKRHTQPQSSHRVFSPAESDPVPINPSATPAKIQAAYAGPTFHASPAPSALPIPKFLSRSVPSKTRAGPPTPPPEDSSDSGSLSPSASPSRAPVAVPPRNEQSPLDLLFKADAAERANNNNTLAGPPSHNPFISANKQRPHHFKHDSYHSLNGVFPIELDGESKHAHRSPPPAASPASQRSLTDPNGVPQLKDTHQQANGNDVMQDLFNRLSMSQKKPTAATPPRPGPQGLPASQTGQSPSPFHDGRPLVRSTSGPTTPQPQPTASENPDFYYGNRNLSPLFKAAQGDSSKRNSGLRTEIIADSPMVEQTAFQGFASVPQPHVMDPNAFSRARSGSGNGGTPNAYRQSMPAYQQSPGNQRRTPGRQQHQSRPDAYQPRGQRNGPGSGKLAMNGPPASAPRPSTTMMSFVPSSVAAKQRKTSTPAATATTPAMKTSTPSDTLALEQDLKRLLNLNPTGDTSGVRSVPPIKGVLSLPVYSLHSRDVITDAELFNCLFSWVAHLTHFTRRFSHAFKMKSLRGKASRFFRDSPTPDEKAAIYDNSDVEFGAGIQGAGVKKKSSRFFSRKNDKLDKPRLESPISSSSPSTILVPVADRVTAHDHGDGFDDLPEYDEDEESPQHSSAPSNVFASLNDKRTNSRLETSNVKPQSSLAALKDKTSRLFIGSKNTSPTHTPPPPPVPQIPVDLVVSKPHHPVLGPFPKKRSSRITLTKSQGRNISISRPQLTAQLFSPPIPEQTSTVPFEKRAGPAPQRPARPDSLDDDTLAFMRETGTRMVLSTSNRGSASTSTASTPRSQASSIEARLGFPSGHGTPRNSSLESPLAARFSPDPSLRLPVRDSSGSLVYSRFSEYVEYQRQGVHVSNGIDPQDREVGPIELFRPDKQGDWSLEKRVSSGVDGKDGGMLFRDRWGGFHFVADI